MERGYVKLWRKSLDSRVFQNPELWQLWTWCLLRAAHKAHWLSVSTGRGRTEIELQPGQLVFGSNVAAAALGQAPRTTLKRLHKLARMGCCTLKNCDHFTVITITNWSTYQPVALGEHEPQGEAKATEGPGNGQARATDKNGGQEEKEETSRGEPAESSLSVGVEASKQPRLEHEAGSISSIPEAAKAAWRARYPNLNIEAELARAAGWLAENPRRQPADLYEFVSSWLLRSDRGTTVRGTKRRPSNLLTETRQAAENKFKRMEGPNHE